ncbi:hypothetical protein [Micromonospora coerulea]|uniref:hypothetical protein n=1 Tax=Micromonospora coerulea TaxID=47856 RepID=UPI0019078E72|nr:hypothetical protein [Micromonospora veneta]
MTDWTGWDEEPPPPMPWELTSGSSGADPVDEQPAAEIDPAAFWTARRPLTIIRNVARERLVSPWAALGGVLAHVCTRIGPHVVLPPIVGGVASLNTFWAFVGSSGAGKDAALAVARELLWLNDMVPTHEVGSGQGIDSTYTTQTKEGPVQFCDSALFTATEIDTIAAHASSAGATLMATLRKVYSGSDLGARYADKQKRRPVRAHAYRAALVAGVQPARSAVLLNDADGGTPQRWLWLPTNDPEALDHDDLDVEPFAAPQNGLWQRYQYLDAYGEMEDEEPVLTRPRVEIKVCDTARNAIIQQRRARLTAPLTGGEDDLNGHALLTRLKVAALLGIFDGGRAEVSEDDWALSGAIMAVSDATRDVCTHALADTLRRANVARAKQEIERAEVTANHTERRVAAALAKTLRRNSGWVSRSDLRKSLRGADREYFDSAIERLRAAGQVEEEGSERGTKYPAAGE